MNIEEARALATVKACATCENEGSDYDGLCVYSTCKNGSAWKPKPLHEALTTALAELDKALAELAKVREGVEKIIATNDDGWFISEKYAQCLDIARKTIKEAHDE